VLRQQPDGNLGDRMLGAIAAQNGPVLVLGTDCPALTAEDLRAAAAALDGADVVLIPAEDGGYVLIGMRTAYPELFSGITWGTPQVLDQTRARIAVLGLKAAELPALWDVDTEADLARLETLLPEMTL
jgi:rSAM/selenodomain-associated transferase 1